MTLELVNTHSRYESLLKGEFGGTDVSLIFVEDGTAPPNSSASTSRSKKSDDSEGQPTQQRREIRAHRAFLRCCGLIRAALDEEHGYAEANRNEVRVVVPPGTFCAVDGLLRWCYDGKCQFEAVQRKTSSLLLESHVEGIAALWSLADFVQCLELCKAIEAMLRDGELRSGSSFAILVNEASNLGTPTVIDAALAGLPLEEKQRGDLEQWLDFGGSEMLNAMAKYYSCKLDAFENDNESEDEEGDSDSDEEDDFYYICDRIVETLGEFLPEMTRENRAEMMPSVFAACLSEMPPDIISEADYADMVLNYIENISAELAELCVVALLSSIDFTAVSRETLVRKLIPRVESLTSSQYALTLCDIAPSASPVITRCAFTARPLREWEQLGVLPCGNIVSWDVAGRLFPLYQCVNGAEGKVVSVKVTTITCPFCRDHTFERNQIIATDGPSGRYGPVTNFCTDRLVSRSRQIGTLRTDHFELVKHPSTSRFRAYLERKRVKRDLLRTWAESCREKEEVQVLSRPSKKSRASLVLQKEAPFVQILNQCSTIGSESLQFFGVDSADSVIKKTLNSFAERNNYSSSDYIPTAA